MIFHQENQRFQSSAMVFSHNTLNFDHKKASLKSSRWNLERLQGGELIDLSYLLRKLDEVTREHEFTEVTLVLRENIGGMSIEIIPDARGKKYQATIYLGYDLISLVDEKEIIIFACHELGHLLDAKSLINNQRFISNFSKFIKTSGLILISALYFFYFPKDSSFLTTLYFLLSCIAYFGGMETLKRMIAAYWQRRAEYEADAYAVKLFGDLDAVIRALGTLKELEDIPETGNLFSTHPSMNQRITALKRRFWIKIFKKSMWG